MSINIFYTKYFTNIINYNVRQVSLITYKPPPATDYSFNTDAAENVFQKKLVKCDRFDKK